MGLLAAAWAVRGAGAALARRGAAALAGARFASGLPSHSKLTLPALSPTMSEGVVANWLKAEGDAVEAGQPVCEIETDKATVDFEVQDDGFLARILVQAGGPPKPVGSVIGIVVDSQDDVAAFANVSAADLGVEQDADAADASPAAQPQAEAKPEPAAQPAPAQQTKQNAAPAERKPSPTRADGERIFASPLARLIARENQVELVQVAGTGPNGRIVRADVEEFMASGAAAAKPASEAATDAAAAQPAAQPAAGDGYFDLPASSDAQALAQQLEKSKRDIPHYYLNSEIDLTTLLSLRDQLNASLPEAKRVSVNDFFVRAAALCMTRVPDVNASWGQTFIRKYKNADINVAIINEEENAVLMPVIRAANLKGLAAIAEESRGFVSDDKDVDFGVGTFTISNLGAFGLRTFTPIVREPQACSLGIGAIARKAVPGPTGEDGKPSLSVVTAVTVTLSCDHRVVDGAVGAAWLQEFKQLLQNPISMLL